VFGAFAPADQEFVMVRRTRPVRTRLDACCSARAGILPALAFAGLLSALACGGSAVAPSQTVTGNALYTYLTYNATAGTIIPSTPAPYSGFAISAVLPDGVTTLPGTYDPATGAYAIPNVPSGDYWLNLGTNYIRTSKRSVDLGMDFPGRPNVGIQTSTLDFTARLGGLAPWVANDYVVFWDWNTGLYYSQNSGQPGDTTFSQSIPWSGFPLMDTTQGDDIQVVQLVESGTGTINDVTQAMAYQPSALTMADGVSTTLSCTLAPVSSADTAVLNFQRSAFTAYRALYNPGSVPVVGPVFEFAVQPGASTYGACGQSLEDIIYYDSNAAETSDLDLGSVPAPAPGPGYDRIVSGEESSIMHYQLSAAVQPCMVIVTDVCAYSLTQPDASHPIAPIISPVQTPTVNGLPMFSNITGATVTPTLAWTAPALGSPQLYLVQVYQLAAPGATTTNSLAAQMYLDGGTTSVKLPSGILAPGNTYFFLITASQDPTYDPTAAPFRNFHFPYGSSQVASGMVTP
jgi:hypothetical protein